MQPTPIFLTPLNTVEAKALITHGMDIKLHNELENAVDRLAALYFQTEEGLLVSAKLQPKHTRELRTTTQDPAKLIDRRSVTTVCDWLKQNPGRTDELKLRQVGISVHQALYLLKEGITVRSQWPNFPGDAWTTQPLFANGPRIYGCIDEKSKEQHWTAVTTPIAEGGSAFVFHGWDLLEGRKTALKEAKPITEPGKWRLHNAWLISREAEAMMCLDTLLREKPMKRALFQKSYTYCERPFMAQTEQLATGKLYKRDLYTVYEQLRDESPLDEKHHEELVRQILQMLGVLHQECNAIHGDFKLENIFITGREHLVLGDFGCAFFFEESELWIDQDASFTNPELASREDLNEMAGINAEMKKLLDIIEDSSSYKKAEDLPAVGRQLSDLSLEDSSLSSEVDDIEMQLQQLIIQKSRLFKAGDIYSAGLVLYGLLSAGHQIHPDSSEEISSDYMTPSIKIASILQKSCGVDQELATIIAIMCDPDHRTRPTIQHLITHFEDNVNNLWLGAAVAAVPPQTDSSLYTVSLG